MQFKNNTTKPIKVRTDRNEYLKDIKPEAYRYKWKTLYPNDTITTEHKDYIKGYYKAGLTEVKATTSKIGRKPVETKQIKPKTEPKTKTNKPTKIKDIDAELEEL